MNNNPLLCSTNCITDLDIISNMINGHLPYVHVFPYVNACMAYLFMDLEDIFMQAEGKMELQLTMRGFDGKVTPVMTDQNCGFSRWEEKHRFEYTTVAANVTASTTLTVTDASLLKNLASGISAGNSATYIHINTGAAPFTLLSPGIVKVLVTAVSGNTLTLATAITVNAGDKVFRGANLQYRCANTINRYDLNKGCEYKSYFQTIQGELSFDTCELSTDRTVYLQKSTTPQYLVNTKVRSLFENLVKVDTSYMTIFGENKPEIAGSQFQETRGFITSIQQAQVCNIATVPNGYIWDIGECADGTPEADESTIYNFISFLIERFESGYYNEEPITLIVNSRGIRELMFLAPAFQDFFGITVMEQTAESHDGCRDYVSLRVHSIRLEYGDVEFVQYPPLDAYYDNVSIAVALPRKSVGFYQRKYRTVNNNMQVIEVDTAVPTFKFKNTSDVINNRNANACNFSFVTGAEFGIIHVGVYNGAYGVLKNFKSSRVLTCTPTVSRMVTLTA